MRWGTKETDPKEWRKVFAFLPVRTAEGKSVWLEYVEKRSLYVGSSWFEDHYNHEYRVIK